MTDKLQTESQTQEESVKSTDETQGINIEGHIKIFDPDSGDVYVDKKNAIHYENFSVALAKSIAKEPQDLLKKCILVTVALL